MQLSKIDLNCKWDYIHSAWPTAWEYVGKQTRQSPYTSPKWIINNEIFGVMEERINFQIKNPIRETFRERFKAR